MFIQLNSNKYQKILQLYSSKWIYVILLQEEFKMEELQLHLHVAHEDDREKLGKTYTVG